MSISTAGYVRWLFAYTKSLVLTTVTIGRLGKYACEVYRQNKLGTSVPLFLFSLFSFPIIASRSFFKIYSSCPPFSSVLSKRLPPFLTGVISTLKEVISLCSLFGRTTDWSVGEFLTHLSNTPLTWLDSSSCLSCINQSTSFEGHVYPLVCLSVGHSFALGPTRCVFPRVLTLSDSSFLLFDASLHQYIRGPSICLPSDRHPSLKITRANYLQLEPAPIDLTAMKFCI